MRSGCSVIALCSSFELDPPRRRLPISTALMLAANIAKGTGLSAESADATGRVFAACRNGPMLMADGVAGRYILAGRPIAGLGDSGSARSGDR